MIGSNFHMAFLLLDYKATQNIQHPAPVIPRIVVPAQALSEHYPLSSLTPQIFNQSDIGSQTIAMHQN